MIVAMTRRVLCGVLVASGCWGSAQELNIPDTPERLHVAPAPSDRFPAKWYKAVGDGTLVVPAPVVDRPYTAAGEGLKARADGSLERVTTGSSARDRLGRTRFESEDGLITIGERQLTTRRVMVLDPVSHCQFDWTALPPGEEVPQDMRVAFVTCNPQTLRYREADLWTAVTATVREGTVEHGDTKTVVEHLPPLPMDGLTVERLRVTNLRRDEHGETKKTVTETWYLPEIREVVRLGDEKDWTGLKDIRREDPDPKLFYPPDGYRIEVRAAR